MKKENISIRIKETAIKLQASKINSIRIKDIERKAVRVYKDGCIGISGAVGDSTDDMLRKQAIENLSANIEYAYELEGNKKDHRDYTDTHYSEHHLMDITNDILDSLKTELDDFILSETLKAIATEYRFSNSQGLDLLYKDEYIELGFIVKAKSSPNLFDSFIFWVGRNLDKDRFIAFAKQQLQAEKTKVDFPKGKRLPVFFLRSDAIGDFIARQLNAETYSNNASLFDGKLGEKLFNEKVTIIQDRNPITSYNKFFDAEGVTMPNDEVAFIENGVLKRVFTDKRNAHKYSLENTGSASGDYDDVPTLGYTNLQLKTDSKDIAKTLNGEQAILVVVAAGGEFNADGVYATPVQSAYLFDGKNILGKLDEFSMSNDIYNILGKDYIGTFESQDIYCEDQPVLFGCYMDII